MLNCIIHRSYISEIELSKKKHSKIFCQNFPRLFPGSSDSNRCKEIIFFIFSLGNESTKIIFLNSFGSKSIIAYHPRTFYRLHYITFKWLQVFEWILTNFCNVFGIIGKEFTPSLMALPSHTTEWKRAGSYDRWPSKGLLFGLEPKENNSI